MLPVLNRLLAEREALDDWPLGFKVLYITPLRALNRDLLGRLEAWCKALNLRVGVRHGDTSQSERSRQSRQPPDLLITTPETLQLLLYGDRLRSHLATVRFVIVDEVHDLAASERGAQLSVALERLEEVIATAAGMQGQVIPAKERVCPASPSARPAGGFVRIGLSATVADPPAVGRFLAGSERPVAIPVVEAAKDYRIQVVAPAATAADATTAGDLAIDPDAAAELRTVRHLVQQSTRALVFVNTRDGAELLVSRSHGLDDDGSEALLELHHGSLDADHRRDVELRFKAGEIRGLVATSSLELGIDVGAIDHVVQRHSPRSVARLVQRLGRAGHRVGATSHGTLVADGPEDAMECAAVARMAAEGRLEAIRGREAPLSVLANQIVALANEYQDLDPEWTRQLVERAAPFAELDAALFHATWEALLDAKTLFPSEKSAHRLARGGRARRHFLNHVSLIPDVKTYRVIDEATKRGIGSVDDAFAAASLHPGAVFVMAGRAWRVLEIEADEDARRVRVAGVRDVGAVPHWSGSDLPVSWQVAQEVAKLRGALAADDRRALAHYPLDDAAWRIARGPIEAHLRAGLAVPTDRLVTIEEGGGGTVVTVNVALGTRGNEALGRVTSALLHQRLGAPVPCDWDAYRIHFRPPRGTQLDLVNLWDDIDPEALEVLVGYLLQQDGAAKSHLVQVAKQFGALPDDLDPNRFGRAKAQALMAQQALQEETLARLLHERLDLEAVADFLRAREAGTVRCVRQARGPISTLAEERRRRYLAPPRANKKLLQEVRRRIEGTDAWLVCVACTHTWQSTVGDLPPRLHCRRCGSNQIACTGPWAKPLLPLLRPGGLDKANADEKREAARLRRNAATVSGFGRTACLALAARGIGPDGAGRLLQKCADPESDQFWRELLVMELEFARTNAFWRR